MESIYNISRRYTVLILTVYVRKILISSEIHFYNLPSDSYSDWPSRSECVFSTSKASIRNVFDLGSSFHQDSALETPSQKDFLKIFSTVSPCKQGYMNTTGANLYFNPSNFGWIPSALLKTI